MFGESFLGQRGDALIDIGMLSIVAVVPVLIWSWTLARARQWVLHKQVQLTTAVVLGVVILLFEMDLNQKGGIFAVTAGSPYTGSDVLNFWIWTHTFCSIAAALGLSHAPLLRPPRHDAHARRRRHRCPHVLLRFLALRSVHVRTTRPGPAHRPAR